MRDCIRRALMRGTEWVVPVLRTIGAVWRPRPERATVLLYHEIPRFGGSVTPTVLERHVLFLKQRFRIIRPAEIFELSRQPAKIAVVLTFDDGFRNNAETVAPILRKHAVPAIFFVCSRHCRPGRYLWAMYLQMLNGWFRWNGFQFGGEFWNMAPKSRSVTVARLRATLCGLKPHPSALYRAVENELPRLEDFVPAGILTDMCAGMTEEQVGELANDPLFEVGGHTSDHPYLSLCEPACATEEILENKLWIERVSGRACNTFSYPFNDYDARIVSECHRLGFRVAHAVMPHGAGEPEMEVQRIGVYSTSTGVLETKIMLGTATPGIRPA